MNKISFFILAFVFLYANNDIDNNVSSIEDDYILLHKSFIESKQIRPKYMFSDIVIQASNILRNKNLISNDDRKSISSSLNKIIDYASKSNFCSGGGYSIYPIIKDTKDTKQQGIVGHNVDFNLNCKFDENKLNEYNMLITNINNEISKNKLLVFPQPKVNFKLTKEEVIKTKEDIFNNFLKKINTIMGDYSSLLNRNCNLYEINYMNDDSVSPRPAMSARYQNAMNDLDTIEVNIPINDNTPISIDINIIAKCK